MRVLGLALVLAVLGWIGRVATAATMRAAVVEIDAGAAGANTGPPGAPRAGEPGAASAGEPPVAAPPLPAPPGPHGRASADDPVYLNHASAEELRRLPGVGPKRAGAILALRQRLGRFQRVEDLLRVKGVGRAMIRKWRPLLRLDSPPAARGSDADAGVR